jgi:hypothetical protein
MVNPTEMISMPRRKPKDKKEPVVTVKIRASLQIAARKLAGLTGGRIEDILSDILQKPLLERLRKAIAAESLE